MYMSSTRTQIYLTSELRDKLDDLVEREQKSMAHIIREALDVYLRERHADPTDALESTFGTMPALSVPSREEWERG